ARSGAGDFAGEPARGAGELHFEQHLHRGAFEADGEDGGGGGGSSAGEIDGGGIAGDAFDGRSGDVSHGFADGGFAGAVAGAFAGADAATGGAELQRGIPAADRKAAAARGLSCGGENGGAGIIRAALPPFLLLPLARTRTKMKAHVWVMPKPTVLD